MVNPGILPLSIIRGIEFQSIILQCKDENVSVTGTLSPDVTGLYVPSGTFNGYPLFILSGDPAAFLYVHLIIGSYVLSQTLSTGAITDYWTPASPITSDPTGTYLQNGAVTGTATVTDHPTDLTGDTVKAEGRRTDGSEELVVDFNPSITDPTNGEITIPSMTNAQTEALPYVGKFNWDLIIIDGDGNRLGPFISGPLNISDNVTQPP